jgi:hypothetical protein
MCTACISCCPVDSSNFEHIIFHTSQKSLHAIESTTTLSTPRRQHRFRREAFLPPVPGESPVTNRFPSNVDESYLLSPSLSPIEETRPVLRGGRVGGLQANEGSSLFRYEAPSASHHPRQPEMVNVRDWAHSDEVTRHCDLLSHVMHTSIQAWAQLCVQLSMCQLDVFSKVVA